MINAGSPTDFQVIDVLPKGSKVNADDYFSASLPPFAAWHVSEVSATNRKLNVHVKNARLNTTKVRLAFVVQHAVKIAPYSLDRASLDFCLFSHLKGIRNALSVNNYMKGEESANGCRFRRHFRKGSFPCPILNFLWMTSHEIKGLFERVTCKAESHSRSLLQYIDSRHRIRSWQPYSLH
jgi:hypothetical protein